MNARINHPVLHYSIDLRIQTYTEPVPLKYGKLATKYSVDMRIFLQCSLHFLTVSPRGGECSHLQHCTCRSGEQCTAPATYECKLPSGRTYVITGWHCYSDRWWGPAASVVDGRFSLHMSPSKLPLPMWIWTRMYVPNSLIQGSSVGESVGPTRVCNQTGSPYVSRFYTIHC